MPEDEKEPEVQVEDKPEVVTEQPEVKLEKEPDPEPEKELDKTEDEDVEYEEVQDVIEGPQFKGDVAKLAKAYKDSQSFAGEKGRLAGEYRKSLEAQGYTFDEHGLPVAPVKVEEPVKVEAPKPPEVASDGYVLDPEIGMFVDPKTGNCYDPKDDYEHEGKSYHLYRDKYTSVIVSQSEWDALELSNPSQYTIAKAKYDTDAIIRKSRYEDRINRRAEEALPKARAQIQSFIDSEPLLKSDPVLAKIIKQAEEQFTQLPPEIRSQPGMYDATVGMALGGSVKDFLKGILQRTEEVVTARLATNPRIIATQSSGAEPQSNNTGTVKLSQEEDKVRRAFEARHNRKISAEEWVKHSNA